ncbi:MAG: hypothetical protein IJV91_12580, partial [Kiritimatiellae bacterium]|nr:hypothetical protein [Kiritimatiellia bacterium]
MKTFFALASLAASVPAFAAPSVSDVEVSQIWAQKPLRVSYSLSGGDAIVTAEVFTNGFPVAAGHQLSMSGDVNRVVQDDGAVKVGRGIREQAQTLYTIRERLRQELGREPVLSELSEASGLTSEEIAQVELATGAPESLQQESA